MQFNPETAASLNDRLHVFISPDVAYALREAMLSLTVEQRDRTIDPERAREAEVRRSLQRMGKYHPVKGEARCDEIRPYNN